MSAAKPGWAIEPIADPLGLGPFKMTVSVKYNGWHVKSFNDAAAAESWIASYTRDVCMCVQPDQSCPRCVEAAARNEAYLKESGIK